MAALRALRALRAPPEREPARTSGAHRVLLAEVVLGAPSWLALISDAIDHREVGRPAGANLEQPPGDIDGPRTHLNGNAIRRFVIDDRVPGTAAQIFRK